MNRFEYAYVGMDIHKETHTAVILTWAEEELGSITIDNNIDGFRKLRSYVKKVSKELKIMYGLEDVTHYGRNLAIFLLEQGYVVKEVNPSLAFYERYPSPDKLVNTTVEELGEFLRNASNNVCSTKKAEIILNYVKRDEISVREYQAVRNEITRNIIVGIRTNKQAVKRIEEAEKKMLGELDYNLESMPGVSIATASALVGHIGDIARYNSANNLASFAGVAPTHRSSAGKGRNHQNKIYGNRELYAVLYFLAIQQLQCQKGKNRCDETVAYYEKKVSEGKTKVQAIICVMRKLVRVIYSMMKNKTEYRVISCSN